MVRLNSQDSTKIPFNKPSIIGNELSYITEALHRGHISGDGAFTKKCHSFMQDKFKAKKVLLTTSCTSALEMAAILCNIKKNDEVILPSYTFVSTANAFYLRGARLIFVDIRPDTLNMDETKIAQIISKRSKAIVPVHYAGIGCDMDAIMDVANSNNLYVIEDAAQGLSTKYKDKYLGTIGHFGAYSFHETKNCICGEGGALVINDTRFVERAEIIRDKGTNRSKFFRGEVDKYTWVDIGSSYVLSDLLAAYLYAQLENLDKICNIRKVIFEYYYERLKSLEKKGVIKLPHIPSDCVPNYHMFYVIFSSGSERDRVMIKLKEAGIYAIFHYLPLHSSLMGKEFGYKTGDLPVTEDISMRLLRLPFYNTMARKEQDYVIDNLLKILK